MSLRDHEAVMRLDELQEAWDTFCSRCLAEPGKPHVYSGKGMIVKMFGDAFFRVLGEYVEGL